jgi:hypothetical protein
MPHDQRALAEEARIALIQDQCAMSYFQFEDHFSELELLRSTIEELISREESSEIERLAPEANQLPERMRGEFWSENHPYWWEHIIAPQFRASFFIALMSAVELHLTHFVRDGGVVAKAPIAADDLKGALYPRSRKFLSRFCAIDSPGEADWQRLLGYYSVRNVLAHAGGYVGEGADARHIAALAAQVNGLTISNAHLEISAAFCVAAHSDCNAFLFEIWSQLVLLCQRSR